MKKLLFWLWPLSLIGVFYLGKYLAHDFRQSPPPQALYNEQTASSRDWVEKFELTHLESKQSLQTLKEKFSKPYLKSETPHNPLYEQEVMDRLHLLQTLAKQPTTETSPELMTLYKLILENKNESWVVQRQALKNIAPLWPQWREKERDRLLSQVDLRARNTWTLSDPDFIKLFGADL